MANYQSQYTGEQIDEAVGKALAGGGGTQLYRHRFTTPKGFVYDAICPHDNAGTDTSSYIPGQYYSKYPTETTICLYINGGLCVGAKENSDYVLQFFYYNGSSIAIAASNGDIPENTGTVTVTPL